MLEIIIPVVVGGFVLVVGGWLLAQSIVIVKQTHRGIIERFGKFKRVVNPGLHFLIPFVDDLYLINITEQMVDAEPQEIITSDNLNARVDAQVYFKVLDTTESIKASRYNVNNYAVQIVSLARTTLRNVIGNLTLVDANSKRGALNADLADELKSQTINWGIEIVRTELKEIQPPADVQNTMNKVVIAKNTKIAAVDFATSVETEADGKKRAAIKEAEGTAQAVQISATATKMAKVTLAEGDAQAIKLVNESADKYFVGNAITLKKLQVAENSLKDNAKIVVPSDSQVFNMIGLDSDHKTKLPVPVEIKKKPAQD